MSAKPPAKRARTALKHSKHRVGILGGSFNPPTLGHYWMALAALSHNLVDEVLFTPCFGHAWGKNLAPADHRLAMCQIATAGTTKMREFDYEINHLGNVGGRTYDFVTNLQANRLYSSDIEWKYLIGADNAERFKEWYEWRKLLKLLPFIVIGRAGADSTGDRWYKHRPHRFLPNVMTVSSTEVRQTLKKYGKCWGRRKLQGKVSDDVLDYIFKHGLYKT